MQRKTPILAITIAILLLLPVFFTLVTLTPTVRASSQLEDVIAVFNSQPLPSNYGDIITAAGGQVLNAVPEIGVVSAQATGVDSATFIQNLRASSAIKEAGNDLEATLIAPTQVLADDSGTAPDSIPPPPSVILGHPAQDLFYKPASYNSPPNQWAIYRVGGFGAGVYGFTGGAWDTTKGSSSVTIAILDTGISSLHPDVNTKIINAVSFTTANLPYDDGTPEDQQGHGTWTASLAAGQLDNTGSGIGAVVGVAPGVSLANVKVLHRTASGGGSGSFAGVIAGIVYAANQGYQVISMSLGGFVDRSVIGQRAVFTATVRATNFAFTHGSIILAAAGNAGLNLDTIAPFIELPGQAPNVIPVVATTNPACVENFAAPPVSCTSGPDGLAFYSDFGSSLNALAAPGGSLPANPIGGGALGATGFVRGACGPGKASVAASQCFGLGHVYYVRAIGTSASTPLVAGAAALVFSVNPTLTPSQVRAILQETAQNIGPSEIFGFGLVDATAAVLATPPP